MPRRRTILSIVRTVAYACLTVAFAIWHGDVKGYGDALLVGAIWGDYVTWLVWSLMELPKHLLHGCYEACANILFGVLLYRLANTNPGPDANVEFTAVMFLAFLLVTGVKAFCLGVVFVEEEIEEEDEEE